jgi:hypothetical protein
LRTEQPSARPHESFSGLIERVTFHNEENGWAVLKVKAKGHRDLVAVVGSLASVSAGEWVTAEGRWVQDKEFGLQFRAEMLSSTAPTTKEGIEKYLGSGMVKGIGPVYAKKLVATFGERIFDIIEQESARLEGVDGKLLLVDDKIVAEALEKTLAGGDLVRETIADRRTTHPSTWIAALTLTCPASERRRPRRPAGQHDLA